MTDAGINITDTHRTAMHMALQKSYKTLNQTLKSISTSETPKPAVR